jgi:hypothetical protein
MHAGDMSLPASANQAMRFVMCEHNKDIIVMELPRDDGLDLLEWLGLGRPEFGAIDSRSLLPKCRRRLWPEPRNLDPPKICSRGLRPAGTLRVQTELLAIALSSIAGAMLRFG